MSIFRHKSDNLPVAIKTNGTGQPMGISFPANDMLSIQTLQQYAIVVVGNAQSGVY